MPSHIWLGANSPHLDQPYVTCCGSIVLGCFGGKTEAGATKNENGAWLLCADNGEWELAMLLDAHATSQSAAFMLQWCESVQPQLEQICRGVSHDGIATLSQFITRTFSSAFFGQAARAVQGETACLIVFRTGPWLYWFSVGDCVAYLLHPDLMRLGQYALNQRQFYEWIGHVNTFDLSVPCFMSGTRELPEGTNTILMVTDGVLECGARPFENPTKLAHYISPMDTDTEVKVQVVSILEQVMRANGRGSAIIVAWRCAATGYIATQPSQS